MYFPTPQYKNTIHSIFYYSLLWKLNFCHFFFFLYRLWKIQHYQSRPSSLLLGKGWKTRWQSSCCWAESKWLYGWVWKRLFWGLKASKFWVYILYLIFFLTGFTWIWCHCCEEYYFDFTPIEWGRGMVEQPLKFEISQLGEKCSTLLLTRILPCVDLLKILLRHWSTKAFRGGVLQTCLSRFQVSCWCLSLCSWPGIPVDQCENYW